MTVYIHTHDRITFKRCRRKWAWGSDLRHNLEPELKVERDNLWFGVGFHFALEDFHGYNRFGHPIHALEAYYASFPEIERPSRADELTELGIKMFEHYTDRWLPRRDDFKTYWVDGKPQVEVKFQLELADLSTQYGMPVIYQGTLDRVVQDEHGRLWVEDYKTAAAIDINKLATDPQISAYLWAAEQWYEQYFAGMVYTQFAKDAPSPPKILRNGKPSLDKRQKTCHQMYRGVLLERFGDSRFPNEYVDFLNNLVGQETPEGDRYIRRDLVERNFEAKANTYKHIMMEAEEMLNKHLYIYPNETRDCAWDCEFRTVCIALNEGADADYLLREAFVKKGDRDEWRKRIKWPTPQS